MFWENLAETMKAFAMALAIAVVFGLLLGFWLGCHRPSGELFKPMLIAFSSIPKITLYPILLLIFGLGIAGESRVRRDPRRDPDRALHASAAVRNVRPVLLKPGRVLRLRRGRTCSARSWCRRRCRRSCRAAHRLFADADRHAAGRDVRLPARARLPADDRDRPAQRRPDHGDDAAFSRPLRCRRAPCCSPSTAGCDAASVTGSSNP